jgi:hypothetical protein
MKVKFETEVYDDDYHIGIAIGYVRYSKTLTLAVAFFKYTFLITIK